MNNNDMSTRRLSYLERARRKLRRDLARMHYPGWRRSKVYGHLPGADETMWLNAWNEARASLRDPSEPARRISPTR